ncbi:MAG: hypothetical protein PHS12_04570 [Candidatus Omnitrophica bacterium]|nr:hypothetical protein [Candidatus Omnitrophota bacterium]
MAKKIAGIFAIFLFLGFVYTVAQDDEALPQEDIRRSAEATLSASENVTLDFKEADIQNVLKIISLKAGVNIVTTPDVMGNVTIRMVDVPWEMALDVILKTYGFGYQKQGNVILVTKLDNIAKIQSEEPLQTEIFTLRFLDAQDAQKIIIPLLSPRGRTSVLYSRGQKGWKFGTFKIGKETTIAASEREKSDTAKSEAISYAKGESGDAVMKKAEFDPSIKSKMLVVTDTYSVLDRIRTEILPKVDIKPKQVLIETKILEVKQDKLKDLGIDWGLGTDGATTLNPVTVPVSGGTLAGRSLTGGAEGSRFTPNAFNPLEGTTAFPGTYPYVAGGQFVFNKMTGTKFQAVLHALEEDANTNILSAPRILTLDNQEASILVGYHTPILTSTVSAGTDTTGPTQTQTLDYYQEIGIRLNVVPQISEEGHINMIVHPSVTSSSSSVEARNVAGTGTGAITTTTNYPIIDVREAQTQVLIHDNETIVIGGLLKDVKTKETIGIPLISKLPWVGRFFRRDIDNISKIDLLIFITARIIKEGDLSKEEIAKLEQGAGYVPPEALNFGDDKKKSWWQRIK